MRGNEAPQAYLFSHVHLENRKPLRHPLRPVRRMVGQALAGLDDAFATMYATTGRPSIPPERLLRALLLQIFYSVRSVAALIEQLDYHLLFRWFVGLAIDDPVWDPSAFSKNRDRLIEADVPQGFFTQILAQAEAKQLLSDEHFSVDGTLIEAWASHKSFQRIEECFGWGKVISPLRKTHVRGVKKVGFVFTLTFAAYNLVRLRKLVGAAP